MSNDRLENGNLKSGIDYEKIKCAIFDLDGTILDSMWVWEEIDKNFLAKRNIVMPNDYQDVVKPLGFEKAAVYTIKRFGLEESAEDIIKEWFDMAYKAYSEDVKSKDNVYEYLSFLRSMGIKMGIATASERKLFTPALKNNKIFDFFDEITTVDEVKRGKGFPDVYEKTADKLGYKAYESIVFEDILAGIKGAKDGGFITVGVYDRRSLHEKKDILEIADLYIVNFSEIFDRRWKG
ncbi:MAG: HAD family phosphatase [Firmicutes bacterium]|nr:HAD family phosphatase [Bacillota bacterium]